MPSPVIELSKELIRRSSVTPDDAGCQQLISERLSRSQFKCESMPFGEVHNLWARHGSQSPLFVFAGHTDVVPAGPLDAWISPPFTPEIREGYLYGRGACDMKGGVAAMIIAAENFINANKYFSGSIAFLLTSDEEGPSINGTKKVIEALSNRNEKISYCIVGEASSDQQVGDQIRVGRRGSLHGKLTIHGKQGHVAFPHLAINPIHHSLAALDELSQTRWDQGNGHFPATTFQISNIHSGTGVANVIPGHLESLFNFRYSNATTQEQLQKITEDIFHQHGLNFDIEWTVGATPFLTHQGKLLTATQQAIKELTDLTVTLSTGGGTSDGRFIAPTGAEVIELGVSHATAHQANECTRVGDLEKLVDIYQRILEKLLY